MVNLELLELQQLLDAWELPDSLGAITRPEEVPDAIRAAVGHSLSLDEWAQLLLVAHAKYYREPPLPPAGIVFRSREHRVRVLRQRRRQRVALRHPDDVLPERDCMTTGRRVSVRRGNHHSVEGELVCDRGENQRRDECLRQAQ